MNYQSSFEYKNDTGSITTINSMLCFRVLSIKKCTTDMTHAWRSVKHNKRNINVHITTDTSFLFYFVLFFKTKRERLHQRKISSTNDEGKSGH